MKRASTLLALSAATLLAVPAAGASPAETQGVTTTQILLGATGPLTGADPGFWNVVGKPIQTS